MKKTERTWNADIIAWIKDLIQQGKTIFQDATTEISIKLNSGKTNFPDILLFTDKISGIVFNGWELKFPDTSAEDKKMLINALEKAEKLKSNSFVTWNGTRAIIWKIEGGKYELSSLKIKKDYPQEPDITTRKDLEENTNYQKHEPKLKARLAEIIHDLEVLYQNGELKIAINISENIISAIKLTSNYILPQLKSEISNLKKIDSDFRTEFNKWKILESATLKIDKNTEAELVLAKFIYYKLIGKILFYFILAENLPGRVSKLNFISEERTKNQLNNFFNQAKKIDYQAVFNNDFTDKIPFNEVIDKFLYELVGVFNEFDFKVLPNEVIGYIFENLVPKAEKKQFGQYFTSEKLAYLVAFPAIKNRNYVVFDPTSGTGTFLNIFYEILKFYGVETHQQILSQIFGNDISHFPSVLSVINLYKKELNDFANFPRVTRADIFNLLPGQPIEIPDNVNIEQVNEIQIPEFDAIISNFPFIQQEDIPDKEQLKVSFKKEFGESQGAFLKNKKFNINEQSDYTLYCFYHSFKFLKDNGYLSIITSNAWLGKDYGLQFKQFLLDNFHIQYIVKSNAEHWFKDSKVSTIFIVLRKTKNNTKPTKFVTFNFKIDTQFANLQQIEDFYSEIENCEISPNWVKNQQFKTVYQSKNNTTSVSIMEKKYLENSLQTQENWAVNFITQGLFSDFDKVLINPFPTLIDSGRGTRTGWDKMFILSKEQLKDSGIESEFIVPIIQNSKELEAILYTDIPEKYLFVCHKSESELKKDYPYAYNWIKKWENQLNENKVPLKEVLTNKPHWYSLKREDANLLPPININERLFIGFSESPVFVNQRLVYIKALNPNETELLAALFNSIISLLIVELNGVSRNLGALDLNADFFKTKMKILNPNLLKNEQKQDILVSFVSIKSRPVESYKTEFERKDREHFDKTILNAFGFDAGKLKKLYEILIETIKNRIEMKER